MTVTEIKATRNLSMMPAKVLQTSGVQSQIPPKTTQHFSHKNKTEQRSSVLVFSASTHSLYETLSKHEVLKSPTGCRSCSCQTLSTQALEDKGNRSGLAQISRKTLDCRPVPLRPRRTPASGIWSGGDSGVCN